MSTIVPRQETDAFRTSTLETPLVALRPANPSRADAKRAPQPDPQENKPAAKPRKGFVRRHPVARSKRLAEHDAKQRGGAAVRDILNSTSTQSNVSFCSCDVLPYLNGVPNAIAGGTQTEEDNMIISAPNMKQLFTVFLSAAAICAFVSATPVVAQETPKGEAPMTTEPPNTSRHEPGNGYGYGPVGAVGAIIAAPFGAITSNSTHTTQLEARCQETRDFNDSEARPTIVCGP